MTAWPSPTSRPAEDRWEITLPWTKPPLTLNQRHKHWSIPARWTETLRATACLLARQARIPAMAACTVTLVYHPVDRRRRDEDNIYPTLKALADGIVDAGVVLDDTPNYMGKACLIGEIRRPAQLVLVVERVGSS